MMQHSPILIIIIPLICALLTPLVGRISRDLCFYWAVSALTASVVFSVVTLKRVLESGVIHYYLGNWSPPWGIEYVVDHLNALMLVLVATVALIAAIYSKKSIQREFGRKTAFYTIFLLQSVGFLGIVVTGDLFNLYVFLEIASLTGYGLIAIGEEGALLASFRYIIMGTVGACFYLLGVGYLYMVTGSLNMADVAALLPSLHTSKVVQVAFAFFMVGVAVKMALFPLHSWLPDAYTRAPSSVSAFLSPLMTKISIYVMIRILFTVFGQDFSFRMMPTATIMVWLGIAAIIAGAFMALAQTDFKRMLCYIIVAEVGYMVGGIGLANPIAIKGAILHLLNDAVMTLGLFLVAGIIVYQVRSHMISDFRACFRTMPFTMTAFVTFALSIIGVPPTGGFFSKWYLLQGAMIAHNWVFVTALLGSSLINIVLFFRVIEIGYGFKTLGDGHSDHEEKTVVAEAPVSMLLPALTVAVAILLIGLYNQPIINNFIQFAVPHP
ncbi:MAG: monovalent cation/H+ antiporter subunit D family protein [Deltaproteobacteria bacterium]|nr:monovalent cation/H+ antiporter subunit D family protein [Deltaproteobacteria bacterium]